MTRFSVLPGAARPLLVLIGLALASCAGSGDEAPDAQPDRVGFRKRRLLMAVDDAFHRLMGSASQEINQITDEFRAHMDDIPTPVQLVVAHPVLEQYGAAEVSRFTELVEGHRETARTGLDDVLMRYEAAFWTVAGEAGRRENGSDFGTRSGYRELDAKVDSVLAQLYRKAGVESVEQMATFRKSDRIPAVRELQVKDEELGTLSLFLSPPVRVVAGLGASVAPVGLHEARAQVITFEPQAAGLEVEWEFLQARRTKVQKGGILLHSTPWQFDHSIPEGRVPAVGFEDSAILASAPHLPRPDVNSKDFAALRDHILISEYRTALCRKDTGEVVRTVGWQVAWGVDYRGQTRVLVEASVEQLLDADTVIPGLLGGAETEEQSQ